MRVNIGTRRSEPETTQSGGKDSQPPAERAGGAIARRTVRSYVLRKGRMTVAQERALSELSDRYLLPVPGGPVDLDRLFGRDAPCTVEIGFGNGDALLALAGSEPSRNFLGIEVYPPGVGHLLARCRDAGIENLRVAMADALDVLEHRLEAASVEEVLVWFPDPWPKKRHHKRRLVQPLFANLVHRVLQPDGRLHLATDWEPYAEHMLDVLEPHPGFENCAPARGYMPRPARRRETRFESRGRRRGHRVFDLSWRAVRSGSV